MRFGRVLQFCACLSASAILGYGCAVNELAVFDTRPEVARRACAQGDPAAIVVLLREVDLAIEALQQAAKRDDASGERARFVLDRIRDRLRR